MWPRGFVAAGAFYRFDPQTNVSSDAISAQMKRLGARLHKRGSLLCPAGCECGYCAACGKPYSDAYNDSARARAVATASCISAAIRA